MTTIITLEQAINLLDVNEVTESIKSGFISYSHGSSQVPLPGNLEFNDPQGDCHIKYGHIQGDSHFVVKIATGFYANSTIGLPSGHGMMSIWCKQTGRLEAIILDNGYLTDVRTAIAGRIVAQYLAPEYVHQIGVVGTGVQARLQLEFLKDVVNCSKVLLMGNSEGGTYKCQHYLKNIGFDVSIAESVKHLCDSCNLIITATPSKSPLILPEYVRKGTHITAVGADGNQKHEIHEGVFSKADIIVVDSLKQCAINGDLSFALKLNTTLGSKTKELGKVIEHPELFGRTHSDQTSICDLTGLAVQDIKIALSIHQKHLNSLALR